MANQAAPIILGLTAATITAIVLYENRDEIRRVVKETTDEVRRRVAIALRPGSAFDQPRFNRPEDADGFMASGLGNMDEDTRKRQRRELMFWNAQREEKMAMAGPRSGPTFDDILPRRTGADPQPDDSGLRRRGIVGARAPEAYGNPFADEYGMDPWDDHYASDSRTDLLAPGGDETPTYPTLRTCHAVSPPESHSATLFDYDADHSSEYSEERPTAPPALTESTSAAHEPPHRPRAPTSGPGSSAGTTATMDVELDEDEYMTAGQEERHEVYSSIQAWAETSNPSFYSPLPVTPAAPMSEPSVVSEGTLTPTDTVSLAGSGEDVGNDAVSAADDVESISDGIMTPTSWSEVGSVGGSDGPLSA